MGTWDDGILDNDTALDGLGELEVGIASDIERLGASKPSAASTAKLGAAVGVLLQLSSYDFGLDTDHGPAIVSAVKAHAKTIAKLPPAARKVLDAVAAGEGKALGDRPAKMTAKQIRLLNADAKESRFGKREASLFASPPAAAYVQEVAKRCVEMIDGDFEDADNWSDLCREGLGLGCLAALMILEPCKVSPAKVARWRRSAKKGIALLEKERDEELAFHRGYYRNLDGVLAILEKRFS
jgi:hypothetical protein